MRNVLILIVLLVLSTFACERNTSGRKNNSDKLIDTSTIHKENQFSQQDSIRMANQNFKISDSSAIRIVKSVQEIHTILVEKYIDTTIKNDLFIVNYPTNQDPFWAIELYQIQPRLEKMHLLFFLFVDANSGEVSTIDNSLPDYKKYSIEEWKNFKSNNLH